MRSKTTKLISSCAIVHSQLKVTEKNEALKVSMLTDSHAQLLLDLRARGSRTANGAKAILGMWELPNIRDPDIAPNTMILNIRTEKKGARIFGNSHIGRYYQ